MARAQNVTSMLPTSTVSGETGNASGSKAKNGRRTEIVVFAAVGLILLLRLNSYYNSPARLSITETALKVAGNSAAVKRLFGVPLRAQHPTPTAAAGDEPGLKEAKLSIPVYGPKGRGQLRIVADRGAGSWIFSRLQIIPQDHPDVAVDALADESATLKPVQDGSHTALVVRATSAVLDRPQLSSSIELIRPALHYDAAVNEFQVDLQTGIFVLRQTDLFIADSPPIALTRTYRSFAPYKGAFGSGASHLYDIWPTGTRNPYTEMNLNLEDGTKVYYARISDGTGFADAVYRHDQTASEFYRSQIFWNGDGWTLRLADLRKILFPEAYKARTVAQSGPTEMDGEAGNRLLLKRDPEGKLQKLISPAGRVITLKYNDSAQAVEAHDDRGQLRRYRYESTGHLETVFQETQPLFRFTYERLLEDPGSDSFAMTDISDGAGRRMLHLTYDRSGRVVAETLADGRLFRIDYRYVNDNGRARQMTLLTLPNGKRRTFLF